MKTKQIWQQAAQLESFSVAQIALLLAMHKEQVRKAINHWLKQGYIEQVNNQKRNKIYRVAGNKSPRLGKGNHDGKKYKVRKVCQQIWNTLKILQLVSIRDVLMVTASGKNNVILYLNTLERCGYARGIYYGNKPKKWRLLKNTGAIAPEYIINVGVFDKNLNQLIEYNRPTKSQNKAVNTNNTISLQQ